MKIQFLFYFLVTLLFVGCASTQSGKLPAGDIDIPKRYASEIATLHNTSLRANSKPKYEAALTLYKNIDFSFVRDVETLNKLFGATDAHFGKKSYEKQNIIFLYRYKAKSVRFVFTRYNNTIISAECTDKLN